VSLSDGPTRLRQTVSFSRRSLGLRARVTATFAAGALLLSLILSVSTYLVVRHTLIEQRESLAQRQTYLNARLVRSGLNTPNPYIPSVLSTLENPTGSEAVLYANGKWYFSDLKAGTNEGLPNKLRAKVIDDSTSARMRFIESGDTKLAVGVPIPAVNAAYFEVSTMSEIERTLSLIAYALVVASTFTTLGGAALGLWTSRLVLRPVKDAALAAEMIAGGDMETRLTPEGDVDLDRLVLSFNRMVDALQTRIQRDARFASDVSHELRSPLMTLASGLSVLQSRRHELPERSQTALDLLADEIQRFQRMVQDLLEISRTDGGQVDFNKEEVLAGEFVMRVAEQYEREIPIHAEGGADEAILEVDKRRMVRVIGNLIENADRYAGGVTEIGIVPAGKNIRIRIDDAGPGVPAEEREHIFERFARGETARARASGEGTGLGLSLVVEHVKLHGGRVWVENSPSGGARFIVELPRAAA
jgi:two-component system, OmpR family, sensor histidine kinase MtrB